ncbi:MAG TPA: aminotransferase [Kineosporiaceae bacterium]|nr:aminotransferase [Kineosporiaceae bacterium]
MTDLSVPNSSTSLVQPTPPDIGEPEAADLARELFGLEVRARALGSHQDRNFLLHGLPGQPRVLLKIANPSTSEAELVAQSLAAGHLAEREPTLRVPRTRPGLNGALVSAFTLQGQTLHARVLDFIDGDPLSGSGYLTPAAVRGIGTMAGRVARAFADFEIGGVERPHQWDLRRAPDVLAALAPEVADGALRAELERAAAAAWSLLAPLADTLPVQVVHGDLTDDNVVAPPAPPGTVRVPDGVIDFGDLNRSWAISEIAVTLSSLLHHAGGSVPTVLPALVEYHAVRPVSRSEAEALWPLVVLRAAVLVASAHQVLAANPENDYAAANLVHEKAIFERAVELPAAVATAAVLDALEMPRARPGLPSFRPLVPALTEGVTVLDLSATSPALHEGRWARPEIELELAAEAVRSGAAATITRYAEPRLTRSATHSSAEPANSALGVMATFAVSQDVLAPWSGILRVEPGTDSEPGTVGMTLIGEGVRLQLRGRFGSAASPSDAGERSVQAGDVLARAVSRLEVRAGRDGEDVVPEFTTAALARAWTAISLDPTALLFGSQVSAYPEPNPGAGARDLLERRHRSFANAQEYYYAEPPVMVRGWKEHLVDADGRIYLDMLNNVTSIGHAHPRLVQAVTEQLSLLNTNSRFNYPAVVDLAERLTDLLPAGLDSVFLVNSGTEAVDLALRISRAWSGRREVLAVREAYHGWSDLTDSVSTSIADNPGALTTRPSWVHTVDAPNSYRGRYRGVEAARYAEDALAVVRALTETGTPVGTFIAEAYYGNAGGMALPEGYLGTVVAAVRAAGGLYVADEVQVGYGRLGEWFWGFEQQGVTPDIVAVAKAMGNGYPLGAVITTAEIAEQYRSQGYFFSSAGGSPVSSVVGRTVLDVIRDERLQQNASLIGGYLKARLIQLADRHPLIGAVHGNGFYLGVEFVRDRETLEPAAEETLAICERLRELGVIMQPTSDRQCVLKIKPPMCLTRESADFFVRALDEVLDTGW